MTLRVVCDNCQAEFALGPEWLGRTVQCAGCRNYFTVLPAASGLLSKDTSEPVEPYRVWVRSAYHILPRAWLTDSHNFEALVRFPALGRQALVAALVLSCLLAYLLLVCFLVGYFVWLFFLCLQLGMGLHMWVAAFALVILFILGSASKVWHWARYYWPRLQIWIDCKSDQDLQPYLLIEPYTPGRRWLGTWVIKDTSGTLLAILHRAGWFRRWLTRRRWILKLPHFPTGLIIEEIIWFPQLLRFLLLLPFGILRRILVLTPWLLKPFRPNYRVRLDGSSYVLAQNRTQLSFTDKTVFELTSGAEQILDWPIVRALAALLHADA